MQAQWPKWQFNIEFQNGIDDSKCLEKGLFCQTAGLSTK